MAMLVASVQVARAQAVRGTVVAADGTSPASGVIVLLEDSSGAVRGRALSDDRGAFVARLAEGGTYRLRALRIGFEPTVISSFKVEATGATPIRLVLTTVALTLPSVSVKGRDVCRGQRADGDVVARVWEEARKALMASGLSTESSPLTAEWIEYERTLDPTARFVRGQSVRTTRSATTHAFRSAPSSELAEHGYVVDTNDGSIFHAPDADVLLSDSFAALHCFHAEPPPADHPTWIGVGFRPAQERQRVSEIEGTFWVDRSSGELKLLDYRYTNLPTITEQVRPGGEVEFMRLSSGSWLINRWNIRMPQIVASLPTTMRRRGVIVRSSTPTSIRSVRLVGGEVSRVARNDSVLFRARGAVLSVSVHASDSTLSVSDVRVTLDGTDYELLTDKSGHGTLGPVLPGSYRVRAQSPLMDSLGVVATATDVVIREGDASPTRLSIPSTSALLKEVCGSDMTVDQGAHVRGVVVDTLGLPVADAQVRLVWQKQIAVVRDRLMWSDQTTRTRTDSLGVWQVCGVPRDIGVGVRVETPDAQGRTAMNIGEHASFASASVVVRAPQLRADGTPMRAANVTFVVTDSTGKSVRDAQLVATTESGVTHKLRTDAAGRASLRELHVGELTVDVRKVGYASGTVMADVDIGENTVPMVLTRSNVPTLATMRVVGDRTVNARHNEFERRREQGLTSASITAEEIAKRNPVSTWQMLTRIPSLLILDSLGYVYARSNRSTRYLCWPRLAIDGNIIPGRPNLAELPAPQTIYGIEVFAGPSRLPTELGGEGESRFCGLIAIWTK